MRRAALVVAVALAGCGGHDDAATAPAPTPSSAPAITATAATSTSPSPSPSPAHPRRRRHARATATVEPPGIPVLGGAVQRYFEAINLRDYATLCSDFAAAAGKPASVVCGRERVTRLIAHRRPGPPVQRVALLVRPSVTVRGRSARASVRVAAFDGTGARSVSRETLRLRRVRDRWVVAQPSPVLIRALPASLG